jgi:hypothetical protein
MGHNGPPYDILNQGVTFLAWQCETVRGNQPKGTARASHKDRSAVKSRRPAVETCGKFYRCRRVAQIRGAAGRHLSIDTSQNC